MKSSGRWRNRGFVLKIAAVIGTTGGIANAVGGLANLPAIAPVMDCAAVAQLAI